MAISSKIKKGDFTADQQLAYKEFDKWIKGKSRCKHPVYILKGYAGSGKTFLSVEFLKLVEKENLCWTVAAPTHKALNVLLGYLKKAKLKSTWYPSTIHRLLRLKIKRDREVEVFESTDKTTSSLEKLDLVLIDEASMISSNLLKIILKCSELNKTKLIFVGDPGQLPPVGEENSPVFFIKESLRLELFEVVRHQGAVLRLANSFRDGKLPCQSPPYLPLFEKKKEIVGFIEKQKWLEEAKISLNLSSLNNNPDEARILCYTNRTLEKLVPHARRAIHGDMADQLPVLPGEVLITRNVVMASAVKGDVNQTEEPGVILGSNREIIVNDITPENFNISKLDVSFDNNFEFPLIQTQIISVSFGEAEIELRMLPQSGSKSRYLLETILNSLKAKANCTKTNEAKRIWRNYFLIKDSFASLGPASVLTIHRSQGSTFDNVFITPDVFLPKDKVLRKKLIYVAVSRARQRVLLVGKPAEVYIQERWENELRN